MIDDAAKIRALVARCPPLDVNSVYAYLLLCEHFAATCAVTERDGRVVGFVSAYRPPDRPATLFVWQVAVAPDARGLGLASRMFLNILSRPACDEVRSVEATVNPSNLASAALFESLAKRLDCRVTRSPLFGAELFQTEPVGSTHEPEDLLRLGPFPRAFADQTSHAGVQTEK